MSTIIVGGGVIGLSTAYYLSLQQPDDAHIHVIDSASALFLSASGYAGGFLAEDWFSPAVSSLGALSFRLHKELAAAHDGRRKWGYASSTAYSLAIETRGVGGKKVRGEDWLLEGTSRAGVAKGVQNQTQQGRGNGADRDEMLNDDGTPAWITKQAGGSLEVISGEDGCAQVEPKELCEWLLEECQDRGVKVHVNARATGICKDEHGRVKGVKVKKEIELFEVDCKNIVIAAGAWSPKAFKKLFPHSAVELSIGGLAGYSAVVRSPRYSRPIVDPRRHDKDEVTGLCHSVFCAPGPNWSFAAEAISRMTRSGQPEVYVAGLNSSSMPLPETADGVKQLMDKDKITEMLDAMVKLTGLSNEGDELTKDDLNIVREGLCFRPISDSGRPVICRIEEKELGADVEMGDHGGVFVATGHGPWGISLSLGTGLVMSEMILGKKTSADITKLGYD